MDCQSLATSTLYFASTAAQVWAGLLVYFSIKYRDARNQQISAVTSLRVERWSEWFYPFLREERTNPKTEAYTDLSAAIIETADVSNESFVVLANYLHTKQAIARADRGRQASQGGHSAKDWQAKISATAREASHAWDSLQQTKHNAPGICVLGAVGSMAALATSAFFQFG